jgi:hypothetical protein
MVQRCDARGHNSIQQRALRDKTMGSQARQAIPHTILNSNVHNLVHNIPPLVPVLSQMNTVHAVTACLKSILILFSLLRLGLLSATLRLPNKTICVLLPYTCHMSGPS